MKTNKLPPARGRRNAVRGDVRFSGPLSECICRNHPADVADFEQRWHRAQMRNWAGHWRDSRAAAAMLGKPVEEVAAVNLSLAIAYRNGVMAKRPLRTDT